MHKFVPVATVTRTPCGRRAVRASVVGCGRVSAIKPVFGTPAQALAQASRRCWHLTSMEYLRTGWPT